MPRESAERAPSTSTVRRCCRASCRRPPQTARRSSRSKDSPTRHDASSAPAGIRRPHGGAVRILHPRLPHGRRGAASTSASPSTRTTVRAGARRQPLPLHRLLPHHRRRARTPTSVPAAVRSMSDQHVAAAASTPTTRSPGRPPSRPTASPQTRCGRKSSSPPSRTPGCSSLDTAPARGRRRRAAPCITAADVPVNEYGLTMFDQPVLIGPLERAQRRACPTSAGGRPTSSPSSSPRPVDAAAAARRSARRRVGAAPRGRRSRRRPPGTTSSCIPSADPTATSTAR